MSKKNDMLGSIIRAMVGVPLQFMGVILDLCNKLAGADGKLWYEKLRLLLREGVAVAKEVAQKANPLLRLLSSAEALSFPACDGTRTLTQAKDLFSSHIDFEFTSWGLDVVGVATPAAAVQVHELVKDGTFRQIFTSLSGDLDKLIMSQHQIATFCQEHREWLRQDGYATFFLFKEKGEFFVACVYVHSAGLRVHVSRFEYGRVWCAGHRPRFVSPQLEA